MNIVPAHGLLRALSVAAKAAMVSFHGDRMHRTSPIALALASVAIGTAFACATLEYPDAPLCKDTAELKSLPEPECMAQPEAVAFRNRLKEAILKDARALLVRVTLDETARVQQLCIANHGSRGEYGARSQLSSRLAEFSALEDAPLCLADRRFDLNRRAAKLEQIKRRRATCTGEQGRIESAGSGLTGPESQIISGDNLACLNHGADWIEVKQRGLRHPLIFARSIVADPNRLSRTAARRKCLKLNNANQRIGCLEDSGWELLD